MKLNAAQRKLLAEGASMEVVMAAATPETEDSGDAAALAAAAAAAAAAGNTDVTAKLTAAQATIETMTTEAATTMAALEAANATIATMTADAATAAAALTAAQETATALHAAVLAQTTGLAVALSKTPPAADMSAADLAALNAKLSAEFKANYKPGSQTAPTNSTATKESVEDARKRANLLAAAAKMPTIK